MRLAARHSAVPTTEYALASVRSSDRWRVLAMGDSDKHADLRAAEFQRWQAGVFECFPGQLHDHPVLRIHLQHLDVGNAEKAVVELVDPLKKAPPTRIDFAGRRRVGIVEVIEIPAVRRDLDNGIPPSRKSRQKDAGSTALPGKRQAIPTTAIGSDCLCSSVWSRACVSCSARPRVAGASSS